MPTAVAAATAAVLTVTARPTTRNRRRRTPPSVASTAWSIRRTVTASALSSHGSVAAWAAWISPATSA
jgi:hypothetical protein